MLRLVTYEAYMNPSYLRRIAKIYGIEDELAKLQSGEIVAIDLNGRNVWFGEQIWREILTKAENLINDQESIINECDDNSIVEYIFELEE